MNPLWRNFLPIHARSVTSWVICNQFYGLCIGPPIGLSAVKSMLRSWLDRSGGCWKRRKEMLPYLSSARTDQGMLDKAQHLNTRAREVFEFTARCCRTTARCHGIGSGNSGGGSSSSRANTPGSENNAGGSVRSSRPSSPTKNDTAAGVVAVEEIGSDVVKFSLSEEELNEGDALLVKIRRCTSAPTNPDDRATKPKSRATVHPGVRHRVEVRCRSGVWLGHGRRRSTAKYVQASLLALSTVEWCHGLDNDDLGGGWLVGRLFVVRNIEYSYSWCRCKLCCSRLSCVSPG